MKIFVSYPSAHSGYAHKLTQALTAQRHEVVSERAPAATPPAASAAVRDAIEEADLFLFVLAPESVVPGSATRLELHLAKRRWPEPTGRVLTIPVAPTPWQDIPRYLKGCTRVRAPGPASVIPDASVCAAAVAELEMKKNAMLPDLAVGGNAAAVSGQPDHELADGAAPHSEAQPNGALDMGMPNIVAPEGIEPSKADRTTTGPAHAVPVLTEPTLSEPNVADRAAIEMSVVAQGMAKRMVGEPLLPVAVLPAFAMPALALPDAVPVAPSTSAQATSLVHPAAQGARPIMANPAHAAAWAGQRSWRRGSSRGSSRRSGRKRRGWWGLVRRYGAVSMGVGLLALLLLTGLAWQWMRMAPTSRAAPARLSAERAETGDAAALAERAIADPVARKVQRAQHLCQEGGFASASQQLATLAADRDAPAFVHRAREDCAMAWLRGAEVRHGDTNFTQLVAPLRPLLAQALAVAPAGVRMADLRAHLAWADYLTWLDSRSPQFDPTAGYQAALAQDPGNPYALAMAAVWPLVQGQGGTVVGSATAVVVSNAATEGLPLAVAPQATNPEQLALARGAMAQFQAASANALLRRRAGDRDALAFVRRLQLGSLGSVPELSTHHIRMLDDMRRGNEPREPQLLHMAWAHLYAPSYTEAAQERLYAALAAEDNLKTYLWCFPKSEPGAPQEADRSVWRLVYGMLLTQAGRGREARADLAALHAEVRMNVGAAEFTRAVDRLLVQR